MKIRNVATCKVATVRFPILVRWIFSNERPNSKMSKNRRWDDLRRRSPRLRVKTRMLIVAEGAVTESNYFKRLGQKVRSTLEIKIVADGSVPITVVQEAV